MSTQKTVTQKVLFVWGFIVIIWSFYRSIFLTSLPIWLDEFITKPLVFLVPVFWYIHKYESGGILSALSLQKKKITVIIPGLIVGLFFLILGFIYHLRFKTTVSNLPEVIIPLITISLATAITEEILSRGFVLKRLLGETKHQSIAIMKATLLHSLLRIPILFTLPSLTGWAVMRIMAIDLLLSIIISLLYIQGKSLYPVIVARFLYIVSITLFLM